MDCLSTSKSNGTACMNTEDVFNLCATLDGQNPTLDGIIIPVQPFNYLILGYLPQYQLMQNCAHQPSMNHIPPIGCEVLKRISTSQWPSIPRTGPSCISWTKGNVSTSDSSAGKHTVNQFGSLSVSLPTTYVAFKLPHIQGVTT